MTVWVGIIGTLLGTFAGGALALLNGRIQFRQQVNRDRQKFLLTKTEELHEVLSRVRRAHQASLLDRIHARAGVETPDAVKQSMEVPIERLELLTMFYVPELSSDLEKIDGLRLKYAEALRKSFLLGDKLGASGKKDDIEALNAEWEPLENACRDMQSHVVTISRKYL